ncbi:MAG: hypothetical protein AMJ93_13785 [Anaerolineae bacterium SM23_84]|nr:MAG: hypothetical protein AMJ93_13785 [Anaerolineae bacterium SM23_84]
MIATYQESGSIRATARRLQGESADPLTLLLNDWIRMADAVEETICVVSCPRPLIRFGQAHPLTTTTALPRACKYNGPVSQRLDRCFATKTRSCVRCLGFLAVVVRPVLSLQATATGPPVWKAASSLPGYCPAPAG